jgi:membrane fusion protein, multidrug efflux system
MVPPSLHNRPGGVCGAPALAAAMALAGLLPGCRNGAAPKPPTAPVVEVVTVLQQDVPERHEWVATTDGWVNATIRAQIQGYLIRQAYTEGDTVKTGQVLFEIDPRTAQAALAQANAAVAQAQAARAQAAAVREQAKAEVARTEALYFVAAANLKRLRPLAEQRAVSQRDLDDAIGTEGSAQAAVTAARAAVTAAEAAEAAAAAAIGVAQAAVDRAGLDLSFTRIVSPIDGIAGLARAQVGDLVGPTQDGELTTVSTVDPIKVYYTVSEQFYLDTMKAFASGTAGLEHEKAVVHELILPDGSVYPHQGTFYAADRQVEGRTGTLRLAARFPNPGALLRPGQFVKVRATTGLHNGALLVPQRAVTELQGSYQVAVVDAAGTVDIRPVQPGEHLGTLWVIDGGLRPGEQVVAEGVQKVREGLTVTARPYTSTPAAGREPPPPPAAGGK